jgi:signal transduction histidine kinase
MRWGHTFLPPVASVMTCAIAWPLWAWRRQEALLDYVSREARTVSRELSVPNDDTHDKPRARRFSDPVQRRLDAMASLSERVRRYRELIAQWVDTLPEATLVTSPDGIVMLTNEQVFVLAEQSELRRGARSAPAGRQVADVLFEITASHRAIEFATQALALLEPWSAGQALPSKAAALLAQGIEVTSARGGRSLLIKCAPIRPSAGRSSALIFHIADVSSMRKAERQRDMALRFLSHDMRSPQAAMLVLADQMRQEPPRFTQQRFTDLVTHYASTALRLSDDFLFLARAESVAPKLTRVDPALALGDAVDDFWPQASAKSTTVNLLAEPGTSLIADAQLLRRAFGNLIGNAIKYSPPASTVKVRLAETPRHLSISVVDQGIGISGADKRQLFSEFSQLDMRFARTGHGLGLALVKTVVDSLGGRLFVRSTLGKGTIFTVRLPKLPRSVA